MPRTNKVQKHFAQEPILEQIPKAYKEYDTFALFLLAYSNRIMFKAAYKIKTELQLPIFLNTLHIRYLLLIHFLAATNKGGNVRQKDIERADYPIRNAKRIFIPKDLAKCDLVATTQKKAPNGKISDYFSVTDKGYIAINMLIDYIHEVYHTHPTNSNNIKSTKKVDGSLTKDSD